MKPNEPVIRVATVDDLDAMASLASQLVRLHHQMDPQRFFVSEPLEKGYRWWFGKEIEEPDAILLVASDTDGSVLGYCYARLQERDWNALLDACGVIHDILVTDQARRRGIGKSLLEEMFRHLKNKGAPRVVLHTASGNIQAQTLFKQVGFRPTMIEMTKEL